MITESDQVLCKLDDLNLKPTLKAKNEESVNDDFINKEESSDSSEQLVFIISKFEVSLNSLDQEMSENQNQNSNVEVLSSILNEFYGSSLEGKKSRLIKVKRIISHEKTPSKDVSIVKQRLREFENKLQDARKKNREERFKSKRNYAKPSAPNVTIPDM